MLNKRQTISRPEAALSKGVPMRPGGEARLAGSVAPALVGRGRGTLADHGGAPRRLDAANISAVFRPIAGGFLVACPVECLTLAAHARIFVATGS